MISVADLAAAAALVASGFKVLRVETDPVRSHLKRFVFGDVASARIVLDSYYAETLTVNAKKMGDATRALKARIFQAAQ